MSSIQAELTGDVEELLSRLKTLRNVDIRGVLNGIAEGVRTSTVERFQAEESPEGQKWEPSIRAQREGGKTLTNTTILKNSIHTEVSGTGIAVGTNDIRAATLQFGAERTIHARNGKYLTFLGRNGWCRVESVHITIPARPFIGINDEDIQDIKESLEELFEEQ